MVKPQQQNALLWYLCCCGTVHPHRLVGKACCTTTQGREWFRPFCQAVSLCFLLLTCCTAYLLHCCVNCSKRRMQPAVAEVAEQLQQLPLACPNSQQQQQPTAAVSDRPRPGHHTFKRYRVSGPAPVAPSAPAAVAGGAGFRSPQAAGQRGCEACDVMMGSPMNAPRMAGGLHPMSKSMTAASSRPSAAMHGHPQQQQQQQQDALGMRQDGSSGGGMFSFGAGSDPSTSMGAAWGECMNNLGAGQHHQPPAGRAMSGDALRCSSMNAMMQATVTDTLFYT